MNRKKRYEILCRFQMHDPQPTIELVYKSSFELLVAVLLSARSTDNQVNKVTKHLFTVANTPEDMLSLGVDGIKSYIKSIGLFNKKSRDIFKISQLLIENYHGLIPESRDRLESMPGIGRKSANVLLNVIFNWPVIAVDTHVFRFSNRSRFAIGRNVHDVENKLLKVVPNVFKLKCHHWFVLHGRYICKAKRPSCSICFINDICEFHKKIFVFVFVFFFIL